MAYHHAAAVFAGNASARVRELLLGATNNEPGFLDSPECLCFVEHLPRLGLTWFECEGPASWTGRVRNALAPLGNSAVWLFDHGRASRTMDPKGAQSEPALSRRTTAALLINGDLRARAAGLLTDGHGNQPHRIEYVPELDLTFVDAEAQAAEYMVRRLSGRPLWFSWLYAPENAKNQTTIVDLQRQLTESIP